MNDNCFKQLKIFKISEREKSEIELRRTKKFYLSSFLIFFKILNFNLDKRYRKTSGGLL